MLATVWKMQNLILIRCVLYVVMVVLVLLLVGCGSETTPNSQPTQNNSQAILGKWSGPCELAYSSWKLAEFLKNGTLLVDGLGAEYSLSDNQYIEVRSAFLNLRWTFLLSNNNDTLSLSDSTGASCTLTRLASSQ